MTHIERWSRTRLSLCNETRAPASTGMKRHIAKGVSIFLVYIMHAQVNRNTRNYKARLSCTSIGFRIHSYGALYSRVSSVFLGCSVADRAISGERRPFGDMIFHSNMPAQLSRTLYRVAASIHHRLIADIAMLRINSS